MSNIPLNFIIQFCGRILRIIQKIIVAQENAWIQHRRLLICFTQIVQLYNNLFQKKKKKTMEGCSIKVNSCKLQLRNLKIPSKYNSHIMILFLPSQAFKPILLSKAMEEHTLYLYYESIVYI